MQNILDGIDRKILYILEEKPSSAYQVATEIKQKSSKLNCEIKQGEVKLNYSTIKFKIKRLEKMGLLNENNELTDLAKTYLPRLKEIDNKEEYEISLTIATADVDVRIDPNREPVAIIPPKTRPGTLCQEDLKSSKRATKSNNLGDF